MKRSVAYPQEVKTELISRYRRSGLSQSQFCRLADVPISMSTLSEWLKPYKARDLALNGPAGSANAGTGLNIVCYNVGENPTKGISEEKDQEPSLQEMVSFQQDVYDCCSKLYRLPCNERSITLLSQIKGVL